MTHQQTFSIPEVRSTSNLDLSQNPNSLLQEFEDTLADTLTGHAKTYDNKDDCFLSTTLAKLISGICSFLAVIISTKLIIKHLRYYSKPDEQRWILRLIFIVPIYSIISFISLLTFGKNAENINVYLDSLRSCYEAFVIYSFLSLCFNGYLGGEARIIAELAGKPLPCSYKTFTCCLKNQEFSIKTLRFCKQATLQFCVIKIVSTVLTLILQTVDLFHQGNFSPRYGYVYIFVAKNISISTALWSLALFYLCTKEILSPYYPLLKFITVKSVIFFNFWQGAAISILELFGYISDIKGIPKGVVASGWQNFLTSCEMFIAAIGFWVAFSYKPYVTVFFDEERLIKAGGSRTSLNIDENNNQNYGQSFSDSKRISEQNSHATNINVEYNLQSSSSRSVPRLERLTNTLKDSLDPRDILEDCVHNFSNRYSPYYTAATSDDREPENLIGESASERESLNVQRTETRID